jgi:hypothetical protein
MNKRLSIEEKAVIRYSLEAQIDNLRKMMKKNEWSYGSFPKWIPNKILFLQVIIDKVAAL